MPRLFKIAIAVMFWLAIGLSIRVIWQVGLERGARDTCLEKVDPKDAGKC